MLLPLIQLASRHSLGAAVLFCLTVAAPLLPQAVRATPSFMDSFNRHGAVMLLIDPKSGKIVDANPAAADFYGYPRGKLRSMSIQEINALSAEEVAAERRLAARENRNYFIFRHRLASGQIRTVEVHSHPFRFGERQLLYSIVHDISNERKLRESLWHYQSRLEQMVDRQTKKITERSLIAIIGLGSMSAALIFLVGALLLALKRKRQVVEDVRTLSTAVEQSPNAVVILDTRGQIEYANPSFTTVTGYAKDEVLGKSLRRFQSTGPGSAVRQEMWRAIEAGQKWQGEIPNARKDGHEYFELVSASPIKGERGEILHIVVVKEDITKRKTLEEQVRRAQKMEAVGELTGGVAHDFNNLLGIVLGNVELLEEAELDAKLLERVSEIRIAAERGGDLTRQLLGFSRTEPGQTLVIDLGERIKSMLTLLRRTVTPRIEVEARDCPDLWSTRLSQGEFEDALMNLILNARDAMPAGGRIILETDNCVLDEGFCERHPDIEPGDFVRLSISDTGQGITPEDRERIFEPFFTTKPRGKGSGLGLAMVFGFVKRSGGLIEVSSIPDHGTTFQVYLPRDRESPVSEEPADDSASSEQVIGGHERILVVDDEPALVDLARHTLEALGYDVVTAADGVAALQILNDDPSVALLFTDVVMPGGINGYELADRAVRARPGLPVLLTSGYSGHLPRRTQGLSGSVLAKPYGHAELGRRVRILLGAHPAPAR